MKILKKICARMVDYAKILGYTLYQGSSDCEKGVFTMNNVFDVCDFILFYETKHKRPLTNLRLQKLLYFIQVEFLLELEQPCFDARMEAWHYGPVVTPVYNRYKGYGSYNVEPNDFGNLENSEGKIKKIRLIKEVLDDCSKKKTSELVEITHRQQPWTSNYKNGDGEITIKCLRHYFLGED